MRRRLPGSAASSPPLAWPRLSAPELPAEERQTEFPHARTPATLIRGRIGEAPRENSNEHASRKRKQTHTGGTFQSRPIMSNGDSAQQRKIEHDFLTGGGEMGARMRELDWSQTSLGPLDQWPQSLKTTVSTCLNSRFAILIWWGNDLVKIYNDAYAEIIGRKHPAALAAPGKVVWPEIWHIIGPMLEGVMASGEATWSDDLLLELESNGYPEERYFTFSYSPIRDESGGVGGVFTPVQETTVQVIAERRVRTLRDLAEATRVSNAQTAEELCRVAAGSLATNQHDLPFAAFYLFDENGQLAKLAGASGFRNEANPLLPELASKTDRDWLLGGPGFGAKTAIVPLPDDIRGVPCGPWPTPPKEVMIQPILASGQSMGFLALGVSPRKRLDGDYRDFLSFIGQHVNTALSELKALEQERRRAEALAEIDRAKTAFFSNVSHEFRTPLTLMLGPIEEMLRHSSSLGPEQRTRLEIAHRNSLRLLRLVNSLLDFSRIESGRVKARFVPIDLAALTADLASNFRSAMATAGLEFVVDCASLPKPVFVDREMWEKIVLNLLSNAFKFTLTGAVTVRLEVCGDRAVLTVTDTGCGIPENELPHLFERFHRVEGASGRTFEGTGIGLALIHELVRLHDGEIGVESQVGRGTAFQVALKFGSAHLPADQIGNPGEALTAAGSVRVDAFVSEAANWVVLNGSHEARGETDPRPAARPRVLLADDNADMRAHLTHLLDQEYDVAAAANGREAMRMAGENTPDLILADVMMPVLDGFGLLRELRSDPKLRDTPVILLTARSGPDARIEGLTAGADDYLTKPFNAGELMARIKTTLELRRLRNESRDDARRSEERYRGLAEQVPDGIFIADSDGRFIDANEAAWQMLGYTRDELLALSIPDVLAPEELSRLPEQLEPLSTGAFVQADWLFRRKDGSTYIGDLIGRKFPDGHWQGIVRDVTERREAEAKAREAQERQAFVLELSDTVRQLSDAVEIQEAASRLLGERLKTNRVLYAEIDGDEAVVHRDYVNGVPSIAGHFRVRDFGEAVKTAYLRDELLNYPDVQNDPHLAAPAREAFASINVAANLSRGLLKNGRWVAAIAVHHSTPRVWTPLETSLVEETALRTWEAVERARTERALRDHRAMLESFYETAPFLMGIAELDGDRIIAVSGNRASLEFFSGGNEQRPGIQASPEPPHDLWGNNYRRSALENRPVHFEYEHSREDGPRWLSATVTFIGPGPTGNPRFSFVAEDSTARRRAQEREREAVVKFGSVFDQSGIFAGIIDLDGTLHDTNELSLRSCGYTREQVVGKPFWETPWWRGSEEIQQRIRTATAQALSGSVFREELRYWFADGTERVMDFAIHPILDDSGAVRFMHPTGNDITDRKRSEDALQTHRELLELVVSHVPAGVCLIRGRDLRIQLHNVAYQRIAPGKQMTGKTMDELWHETGQDFSSLCRRVLETGEPHHVADERNMVHRQPGGALEEGYFSWSLHRVPLPGGEGWGLLNSAWETTERVRAESALRDSEATLRAYYENSPLCMGITELGEADVFHVYDNPATCRFFGVEPGTTAGKWSLAELGSDTETIDIWSRQYRASEQSSAPVRFEHRQRTSTGERWLSATVSAIGKGDSGRTRFCYVAEDVTERKQSEEALRRSEAFLGKVLDSSLNGVYVYDFERGLNVFINRQYTVLTGYSREQIDGMRADQYSDLFHPDDRAAIAAHLKEVSRAADGQVAELEYRFRRSDGLWIWCLSRDAVFARNPAGEVTQSIGSFVDITARKEAEIALADSEARFRTLAESMPQLVWTCTADGLCDYLSTQWVAFTGMPASRQLGYDWLSCLHPDDRPGTIARWHAALESRAAYDAEFRIRRYDGVYRWFKSRANPHHRGGKIVGWFGTCTDIEDQKRTEEDLRRANVDLEQFAYSASHDLQEPLRNVAVYSQLISKRYASRLDGDATQFLEFIVEGAHRMSYLVTDLLEYTRAGAPNDDEPLKQTEAETALAQSVASLSRTIEEWKGVVTHDVLPAVYIRSSHLQQLFQNLISNALKYRKDGEAPRVHVSAERQDSAWRFSIADNGIGIAPEFHHKIFGVFKRLHSGKYAGTGIGLAICQKIAERYGGRIWVESQVGSGSVFYFTIPHRGEPVDLRRKGD